MGSYTEYRFNSLLAEVKNLISWSKGDAINPHILDSAIAIRVSRDGEASIFMVYLREGVVMVRKGKDGVITYYYPNNCK